MAKWYDEIGEESDVVISSRVRLARNLKKYPFPTMLSADAATALIKETTTEIRNLPEQGATYYHCCFNRLDETEKLAMVERHIVSMNFAVKKQSTGLILSEDESISIMLNEEDHVRIQAISAGMNARKVWEMASKIDDMTEEVYHYAYDEQFGYLTSCPTNTGTGLRASYMVFLPAMAWSKSMTQLCSELPKFGITIRGIYGEGSTSLGNIYQISNQKTLGNSEIEIIENLNNIVKQVIHKEHERRDYFLSHHYDELEDQIYRSYGLLKYATQLGSNEAVNLLTQVKFGLDQGIIKFQEPINIYSLIMAIQPANLQMRVGKGMGSAKRDRYRAEYMQEYLPRLVD